VIAASVDDRTRQERGLEPLVEDRFVIPKSRYGSVDAFIAEGGARFNDVPLVVDPAICATLQVRFFFLSLLVAVVGCCCFLFVCLFRFVRSFRLFRFVCLLLRYAIRSCHLNYDTRLLGQANGMDEPLARHFAHLYIRDPLVLYGEVLAQPDEGSADHFENIQSTNWQTMRFKPPPPDSPIGWRVEFRSAEVQTTDFENAAFTLFVVLLSRTILSFGLDLYTPLSLVEANMQVGF
jgi:glutamate--cysteine ligase catalytic subunit